MSVPDIATFKQLANTILPNAAAALYTSPDANTKVMIVSIVLHNYSGSDRVVTLWAVPTGSSQANQYQFYKATLNSLQTDALMIQMYLPPQGMIWGMADAATSVSIFLDGAEVAPQT